MRASTSRQAHSATRRLSTACHSLVLCLGALLAPDIGAQEIPASLAANVGRSHHIDWPWPIIGASLTDPSVADVQVLTPLLVQISGVATGSTDLVVWGEDGRQARITIDITRDLSRIKQELAQLFPGSSLDVMDAGVATIVTGMLGHAEQAPRLRAYLDARGLEAIDLTSIPGAAQVQVQVRIAEVSRARLRQLGVNFLKTGDNIFGGSLVGPSSGGAINPVDIGPPLGAAAVDDVPFVFTSPTLVSPSVTLFAGFHHADLEMFLTALEENDYLRILAEPNLVALSGEDASFLAGGEFPIPVVQGSDTGGTSITIDYREFGVSLRFRPMVLGDGRIRLRVASEVSDLSEIGSVEIQGFSIPAIVTRNAETTIEMGSGETFAMAGLIKQDTSAQVSRIPGLGDLPILGPLFRSVRYQQGETELILLVTANLVEPLSLTETPPLPGEDHVPPSDWDLYVQAKLEGPSPSPDIAAWLTRLGVERLRGPGAWATHEDGPAAAATDRASDDDAAN